MSGTNDLAQMGHKSPRTGREEMSSTVHLTCPLKDCLNLKSLTDYVFPSALSPSDYTTNNFTICRFIMLAVVLPCQHIRAQNNSVPYTKYETRSSAGPTLNRINTDADSGGHGGRAVEAGGE